MPNPTVPQVVSVYPYDTYDLGSGLPVLTRKGVTVSVQSTLDSIIAAAAIQGIQLGFAAGTVGVTPFTTMQSSGAFSDGQLAVWSANAGAFIPVNASGAAELAYAENITATGTNASAAGGLGTAVDIPGAVISVPASGGRPVTIGFGAVAIQTAVGLGQAYLSLIETTSGNVSLHSSVQPLPNSLNTAQYVMNFFKTKRIGAVASTRSFKLSIQLFSPAANNPAISLLNQDINPTFIEAISR